jgi:hypothetical protein
MIITRDRATVYWDDKFVYLQSEKDKVADWLEEFPIANTAFHMLAVTVTNSGLELRIFKFDRLIDVVYL